MITGVEITDGWISPEGTFYPSRKNLTIQDEEDYTWTWLINGHTPCAWTILREIYDLTEENLYEKTGYIAPQDFLMEVESWMRVDILSILGGVTAAQVETLRQMLTLPLLDELWDEFPALATEIIERWEDENAKPNSFGSGSNQHPE